MKYLYILLLLVVCVSCNGGAARRGDNGAECDSVMSIDTINAMEIVLLPDTIYESARSITYRVDTFDTIHSGAIEDFRDLYNEGTDILTFRRNFRRDADFGGVVAGEPNDFVVDWVFTTAVDNRKANIGSWGGGSGWTGQPLLVDSMLIMPSLSGYVYFLGFDSGNSVMDPIHVYHPIKGTSMLDPIGKDYLYVGHGVKLDTTKSWGNVTISLKEQKIIQTFGEDKNAWKHWHAFDSSPLRLGQFVYRPGENGTLYKWYCKNDTLLLHSTLRFRPDGTANGMEASMAIYKNYGYVADNHGNIVCINMETLQPVWRYFNHDDTDASLVIEEIDGVPYLYTGCEIDRQGGEGNCYLVKLNAINGERVWETTFEGRKIVAGEHKTEGGLFATPLLGKGDCSDLLFVCIVTNKPSMKGDFVAVDRTSGEVKYRVPLSWYPWMSPVGFLNENGKQFVVAGDTQGRLYLIEGRTGNIICKKQVGANFESSPVVRGNHLVVGSRGNHFYRVSVITNDSVH